jgi:hypothetical protein
VEAGDLLGDPGGRDRQGDAPAPPLGGDQVEQHEQGAAVGDR